MSENIFSKIKRHISQFFETEYWYRFRKLSFFWLDDETGKYIERKERARDLTTITWDGENDILGMMLLKIDHMYYNLKHYGCHSDFYFDSFRILENGTIDDKVWAFHQILKECDYDKSMTDKEWEDKSQYNLAFDDGTKENQFIYGYDANDRPLYYIRRWNPNGTLEYLYGHKGNLFKLNKGLDIQNKTCRDIIEGVIQYNYSVNIPIEDYHKLSSGLQKFARGNRRTLTELLHLRHMVKKLYLLEDTDDKYYKMWADIKDSDEKHLKLREALECYQADRHKLYHDIAEFMAENGNGWWD